MNDNIDKKVAYLIIKAQMCSDSGKKGIENNYYHYCWKYRSEKFGYGHKNMLIFRAMDRIAQMHGTSGFHYFIGHDRFDIVYFNFKIEGNKYQISFHVPGGVPERYKKYNDKHVTHWDHNSSREACYALSAWIG